MSEKFANRQREAQQYRKGRPTLSLEFDVYEDGELSMWAHTRHEVPFDVMKRAFEKIRDHVASFIENENMCPFNPSFLSGCERFSALTEEINHNEKELVNGSNT